MKRIAPVAMVATLAATLAAVTSITSPPPATVPAHTTPKEHS